MGPKVLVVDDSMMVRRQVALALTGAGYRVVEAVDGVDALEKLAQANDVAVVVCDVNMPRMDGLELLARLHDDDVRVPVVMLTTERQPALFEKGKALGAKGWLVKPFKPEHLIATVRKLALSAA